MLRSYADIITKLGQPLWYDGNGCPRYCAFHPDECGIYDDAVVLLEIACQACGKRFLVASEWNRMDAIIDMMARGEKVDQCEPRLPSKGDIGSFGWGDPPQHDDCAAGATMSCDYVRVVECWSRNFDRCEWTRLRDREFQIGD